MHSFNGIHADSNMKAVIHGRKKKLVGCKKNSFLDLNLIYHSCVENLIQIVLSVS